MGDRLWTGRTWWCGGGRTGWAGGDEQGGQGGRCKRVLGDWGRTAVPAHPCALARAGFPNPHPTQFPPWPSPAPQHIRVQLPQHYRRHRWWSIPSSPLSPTSLPWLHGGTILARRFVPSDPVLQVGVLGWGTLAGAGSPLPCTVAALLIRFGWVHPPRATMPPATAQGRGVARRRVGCCPGGIYFGRGVPKRGAWLAYCGYMDRS